MQIGVGPVVLDETGQGRQEPQGYAGTDVVVNPHVTCVCDTVWLSLSAFIARGARSSDRGSGIATFVNHINCARGRWLHLLHVHTHARRLRAGTADERSELHRLFLAPDGAGNRRPALLAG